MSTKTIDVDIDDDSTFFNDPEQDQFLEGEKNIVVSQVESVEDSDEIAEEDGEAEEAEEAEEDDENEEMDGGALVKALSQDPLFVVLRQYLFDTKNNNNLVEAVNSLNDTLKELLKVYKEK